MTQAWTVVDNPAWAGVKPAHLTGSACHDRSHCLDIRCGCGFIMHVHESQISHIALNKRITANCKGCGEILTFEPGQLPAIFAEMRRQGWIV